MKKTIAILTLDITICGGIERVVCNLANSLVRRGNFVPIIISLNSFDGRPMYELNENVKLIHVGVKKSGYLVNRVISCFGIVRKMSYYCRVNNVDIIMGTYAYLNVLQAFIRNKHLVKIACEHNIYDSATFYASFIRRIIYPKLDAVVVLTKCAAERYTFCKNVTVIPNGISFIPTRQSSLDKNVILAVGRYVHEKGFVRIIEAIDLIKGKCSDWQVRIVGDGEDRDMLQEEIKRRKLEDIVKLFPATDAIENEYCNSSLYVMSSRFEGFGLVLVEAKACGLPIVSFDCPEGPADIVRDGIDGILVENGNVEALSKAILTMIENPMLRKKYGQEAVKDIDRFSPECILDKWEGLFSSLLDSQKRNY